MVCLPLCGSVVLWDSAGLTLKGTSVIPTSLSQEVKTASALIARGHYSEAVAALLPLEIRAHSEHQIALEAQILNNIGACYYRTMNYGDALRTFIRARAAAEASGQQNLVLPAGFNISSLYLQMGNLDAAEDESRRSLRQLDALRPEHQVQIECQLGRIAMRREQWAAGRRFYETALKLAQTAQLPAAQASALEYFSYDLLVAGDVAGARDKASAALQLRLKNKLPGTEVSYWALGRAASRGDHTAAAERYYKLAFAGAVMPGSNMPLWALYRDRGKLRLKEGRLREAIADLRIALKRSELVAVIPTDDNRIAFESGVAEIYSAFVEAGNLLALRRGGDPALSRETFEVNERGRNYSLRALLPDANDWRRRLPPRHGELLVRLQDYERIQLSHPSRETAEAIRHLHLEIEETELAAGAAADPQRTPAFSKATRAVGANAALVSLALGTRHSWLWTITAQGLRLHRLPPRAVISQASQQFSFAVQSKNADAAVHGRQLYQLLFGPAQSEIAAKRDWLLSFDGDLFSVPLAALVSDLRGQTPVYLMEQHAVQYLTGAQMLHAERAPPIDGPFVGLGDPIYNLADPRYAAEGAAPRAAASGGLHLTRLSGSGRELAASAAAWGRQRSSLLLGAAANKARLRQAMVKRPAVLHVAAHVLERPGRFHSGLIALSLNAQGEVDLLTPDEIVKQAQAADLVVLSGCSTGRAKALPGVGLMGLTRAWIGAGADAVVATLWPTSDDDGYFFEPFYESLRHTGVTPAAALRTAQIHMLHSGTFRARPEYWSAYFVVENYR